MNDDESLDIWLSRFLLLLFQNMVMDLIPEKYAH